MYTFKALHLDTSITDFTEYTYLLFSFYSLSYHSNASPFQDTRAHAEAAKEALDGTNVMGRQVRVRFAVNGASIRVKELSPIVSNEMLYNMFSLFGEVERAVHIVDERGKPTGEGIVEFERKAAAQEALRHIEDRVLIVSFLQM